MSDDIDKTDLSELVLPSMEELEEGSNFTNGVIHLLLNQIVLNIRVAALFSKIAAGNKLAAEDVETAINDQSIMVANLKKLVKALSSREEKE